MKVGAQPHARLAADGQFHDALQIGYFLKRPHENALAAFDEWVNVHDGSLTQSILRNTLKVEEGKNLEFVRFQRQDHPALFGSALVWGKEPAQGSTIQHAMSSERHGPLEAPIPELLELRVESGSMGPSGKCRIWLSGHTVVGTEATPVFFEFEDGLPAPVQVTFTPTRAEFVGFQATLEDYQLGMGTQLPGLNATAIGSKALKAPDDFLLAESRGVFPLDWPTAMQAIRNDAIASGWLAEHPDSRPLVVIHLQGRPNASLIDEWLVQFWSGNADPGLEVLVSNEQAVMGQLPNRISVSSQDSMLRGSPTIADATASLKETAGIFRAAAGTEPEILYCQLDQGFCGLGTHASTGQPFADDHGSALFISPGLTFGQGDGLFYSDQSITRIIAGQPLPGP